jgi:hypothetical protein
MFARNSGVTCEMLSELFILGTKTLDLSGRGVSGYPFTESNRLDDGLPLEGFVFGSLPFQTVYKCAAFVALLLVEPDK